MWTAAIEKSIRSVALVALLPSAGCIAQNREPVPRADVEAGSSADPTRPGDVGATGTDDGGPEAGAALDADGGCTSTCNPPPDRSCADDRTVRRISCRCVDELCDCEPTTEACPSSSPACFEGECYATPTCGGCLAPPRTSCSTSKGKDEILEYASPGTCLDPKTNDCAYSIVKTPCDEDCVGGACTAGEACSLGGSCSRSDRGCKLKNDELRCLPFDSLLREGVLCDPLDRIPDYRCNEGLTCVQPSFATSPLCAYICATDDDCRNVGLLGNHTCVKTQGHAFGWCR